MKKFRKVLSLVLALALVFGLSATAFAASSEDTTGSITISGAIANEQYTIYQIFDLTYTDDGTGVATGESYSYKVNENWEQFITDYQVYVDGVATNLFTLTSEGYLSVDSLIYTYEDDADVVAQFARAALAYAQDENNGINGNTVSFSYDTTAGTYVVNGAGASVAANSISTDENGYVTGDLTFTNLDLGWYLVGTTLGSLCILDSTTPTATINEKNSTPIISKHVYNTADTDWEQEDHENNNTQVTYELDVDHITGAVNLVIHDSQPSEIEENWTNFHPTVRLIDGDPTDQENITTLVENTDYTIKLTGAVEDNAVTCSDPDFDEEYGCTFEIDFTGYDFSNVSDEAYIEVIYTGMLETDGDIYVDDVDEIDNFAVVTFGTSTSSPVVEAEVYSFGFEVFKYTESIPGYSDVIIVSFSNDNPDDATWQDELYLMFIDENGNVTNYATFEPYDETNNIYVITGWVTDESQASYIYEPENGDSETYTAYFYVPTNLTIPEHIDIQLDEDADNPDQETNEGYEIVSADEFSQPLANAVFQVSNASGQTAYFVYEEDLGIYLFEGWLDEDETLPENSDYTTSVTSGSDGMIYIDGLDQGTYTVTEIAAPDGYNLLDESIYVTIWATYDGTTGAITDHGVTWSLEANDEEPESGVVNVLNSSGTELPGTGGIGTTWFYIIGAILVVGAAVVLVTRRRVNAKAA